jgi:hypothetical protein
MKKLMTAIALVALAATPTFAATYHPQVTRMAAESYASVSGNAYGGTQPVFFAGKVIGADPDANVRLQLQKGQTSDASQ